MAATGHVAGTVKDGPPGKREAILAALAPNLNSDPPNAHGALGAPPMRPIPWKRRAPASLLFVALEAVFHPTLERRSLGPFAYPLVTPHF